jgi:2-polyprenyl-3-methyl-5-hydroxy-6-metoxy-1,4-benzoquinol methylase
VNSPYDASYYTARDRWLDRRKEAEVLLRTIRLDSRSRLLDVGCGGGLLLSLASRTGARTIGVEVNIEALRIARTKAPGAALVAVGQKIGLPFRDGTFDAVVSQHVLEHLDHPVDHLREWRRMVGQHGAIVLATPNAWYPDPAHFFDTDHRHVWNVRELGAAFQAAGFVEASTWSLFPFLGKNRFAKALSVRLGSKMDRLTGYKGRGRTLIGYASL